jgi:hypothetical protein
MHSDRVEEIAALRAQKKLDREAEVEAREAKEAEEASSHAANMARIAKKMARIEAGNNAVAEEPVVEKPAEAPPAKEPVVAKKKPAAKKAAARTKSKPRGRPKGSKNRK